MTKTKKAAKTTKATKAPKTTKAAKKAARRQELEAQLSANIEQIQAEESFELQPKEIKPKRVRKSKAIVEVAPEVIAVAEPITVAEPVAEPVAEQAQPEVTKKMTRNDKRLAKNAAKAAKAAAKQDSANVSEGLELPIDPDTPAGQPLKICPRCEAMQIARRWHACGNCLDAARLARETAKAAAKVAASAA